MGPLVLLCCSVFSLYVGARCLYMYYKHGFYPPNDRNTYRNCAWGFTLIGAGGILACVFALLVFGG
jgi:hypothetical protein